MSPVSSRPSSNGSISLSNVRTRNSASAPRVARGASLQPRRSATCGSRHGLCSERFWPRRRFAAVLRRPRRPAPRLRAAASSRARASGCDLRAAVAAAICAAVARLACPRFLRRSPARAGRTRPASRSALSICALRFRGVARRSRLRPAKRAARAMLDAAALESRSAPGLRPPPRDARRRRRGSGSPRPCACAARRAAVSAHRGARTSRFCASTSLSCATARGARSARPG